MRPTKDIKSPKQPSKRSFRTWVGFISLGCPRICKGDFVQLRLYKNPIFPRKWGLKLGSKKKLWKKQAAYKISTNMPLVEGIFFEIHGSKLKPDPSEISGQAAKMCKPHCAFFLCVGEHTLYSFFASVVKISEFRRVSVVLNKFKVICPDVLFNGFYAVFVFGTLES